MSDLTLHDSDCSSLWRAPGSAYYGSPAVDCDCKLGRIKQLEDEVQRLVTLAEGRITELETELKSAQREASDLAAFNLHLQRQDANSRFTAEKLGRLLQNTQAKIDTYKRQLTIVQRENHQRNVEMDALHYVWCDGGCKSGVHRFGEHPPLTEAIIAAAERNVQRLRRWFVNKAGRELPPTVAARTPAWRDAEQKLHEEYVEQTNKAIRTMEREVIALINENSELRKGK